MTPRQLIRQLQDLIKERPELANKQVQIWVDEANGTRSVHVKATHVSYHGSMTGNKPAIFGDFDICKGKDYS